MKKIYFLVMLMSLFMTGKCFAQFYDSFTASAGDNIGGNCTNTACNNNNWYTHSGTLAGTIDILSGSLTFPGLIASLGNKILLPGSNGTVSRDVNAAVTVVGNVAYYSALVKVVDATQISSSGFDYFMSFGSVSGNSVTNLFGRLGIKAVNSSTNFHLGILNNSSASGTPAYFEDATDRSFGATYLIVVKVDLSVTPNVASLWVNPSGLGGAEPASIGSANSGTNTSTTFGSICLRNGTGTPKAEIDEIRVGSTWADVTPVAVPVAVTASTQTASNAAGQTVNVQSNLASGKVYIILNGITQVTQTDLDAAVAAHNGASATVNTANTDIPVSTAGLTAGNYYAYAVDGSGTVSPKGTNLITITVPVINPPAAPANLVAVAASMTQIDLTWTDNSTDEDNFKIETSADGNTWTPLATVNANVTTYSHTGLTEGTKYYYRIYALNAGGNSNYSNTTNATTLSAPPTVTAIVQIVNNIGQSAKVQSTKATGAVYIILNSITPVTVADLDAAVTAKNGAKATVTAASTDIPVSAAGLNPGVYYAYAVDGAFNMSSKGTNAITVTGVATSADSQTDLEQTNAYIADGNLVIEIAGNFSKASAQIFDLMGRKIAAYTLISGINKLSPGVKGIIILRMVVNNEIVTKKIYVP